VTPAQRRANLGGPSTSMTLACEGTVFRRSAAAGTAPFNADQDKRSGMVERLSRRSCCCCDKPEAGNVNMRLQEHHHGSKMRHDGARRSIIHQRALAEGMGF
jgi:hypothetical protein